MRRSLQALSPSSGFPSPANSEDVTSHGAAVCPQSPAKGKHQTWCCWEPAQGCLLFLTPLQIHCKEEGRKEKGQNPIAQLIPSPRAPKVPHQLRQRPGETRATLHMAPSLHLSKGGTPLCILCGYLPHPELPSIVIRMAACQQTESLGFPFGVLVPEEPGRQGVGSCHQVLKLLS